MTFDDILEQVITLLKRQGRVSYRALKMRFEEIDDEYLDVLKEELFFAYPVTDENDRGLVWTGETEGKSAPASQLAQPEPRPVIEQVQPVQATQPIESHTPEAERRQLTVMFVDLVGSTALSSRMDAEDYREVVRAYQTTCSEVIQRFDCHIAQTLGDGLLIYSGYPVAHENDAERAVRAGLGILTAMQTLNERLEDEKGVRLAVRVGVHTGPVVVGEVGAGTRQEQLALGEVPNVASRMEGLAEPNTLIVSADTYRLIQGYFDCDLLGEHDLRGVSQPIAVYQVLQESGAQNRLDVAATKGLTPLVGREKEVGLLLDRWAQSRDGNGQVVLLSGEAGIGKSRLVQALKDHVSKETYIRLECRSSPYFTNSALYPVIDMIQRTLRFQADNTPEQKLEKLEQNLSQYRLSMDETVPLFSTLLSLPVPEDRYLPLDWSPQRQREKTLEAIVAITLEWSEQQPVLFILEDLHWTDPTTLEFLELLIDQTPTASLYVLVTCRPEYQPSWSHRSYLTEITVNRLSREGIEEMATKVAGEKTLPDEVLQQLAEKTDGVPLYVEEMTKAVLESGALKESDGQYELTGSMGSLTIPATLQDSLMARLDCLVTAKAVAQYASVIGRQFSYELLQAVSQVDEVTLRNELSRLVEAELVYQRGILPQATYFFKHALIQDIAYESLLRGTRQGYHRRIAEVLEERFLETAENQPELLAYHFTEAGLIEPAVVYWHKAGEKAVQRSANVEAIEHFTKGLELLRLVPVTVESTQRELALQLALGVPLFAVKGFGAPEVERVYTRAYTLCQQVEEMPQRFLALEGLWRFYLQRGEHQTGRDLAEQLLTLAHCHQDPLFFLPAHRALGGTLVFLGEFVPARMHLEQGMALYDSQRHKSLPFLHGGTDFGTDCLSYAALALWLLGYPDQALGKKHEMLVLADNLTHSLSWGRARVFAAWLHQVRREAAAIPDLVETAITLFEEQGPWQGLGLGMILRGWALAEQGQEAEGISQMHEGLDTFQALGGGKLSVSSHLVRLAEVYGKIGKIEDGLAMLHEAQVLVDETDERWYEAELHRLRGELLLAQSSENQPEAESCFQKAITIAQNQSAKSWELRASTSLAKLWQSQGKRQEAYDLVAPVYGWFTEGFDTADLIDAKALLDELGDQP